MLSRQRLLPTLPLIAALLVIGCGGHSHHASSNSGTTGNTRGTGGAGTIDLTITKKDSNAAFASLKGDNAGSVPTFTLSDTNRNGNGVTTLQAIKTVGSQGTISRSPFPSATRRRSL